MANHSQPDSDIDHPSPHRDKVSLGALWFGIWGAPVAWTALELISYVLSMGVCGADAPAPDSPHAKAVWGAMLVTCILTSLLVLAATAVAINNWRRTRHEHKGSAHHLLEVGEGRARFLAMFGLLISAGFIVAFIFVAASLLLLPLCR